MTAHYVEKVHRGLINTDGHVEDPSLQVLEWQSLHYLGKVDRCFEIDKKAKKLRKMKAIQKERGEQLAGAMMAHMGVGPGEPGLSGATAIIVLDGGRIVYVEPAEPEAAASPAPMAESEPTSGDESMEADDDAMGRNYNYNRASCRPSSSRGAFEDGGQLFHGHRSGNKNLMSEMMHESVHFFNGLMN